MNTYPHNGIDGVFWKEYPHRKFCGQCGQNGG